MESEMISAQKSAIQLQRNSSPSSASTFTAKNLVCSWNVVAEEDRSRLQKCLHIQSQGGYSRETR